MHPQQPMKAWYKRGPAIATFVVSALVALALIVGTAIATSSAGTTPTPPRAPEPTSTPVPEVDEPEEDEGFTAAEQRLLDRLPSKVRDCERSDEPAARAVAALVCVVRGDTVYYDMFRTRRAMNRYYNDRFAASVDYGYCSTGWNAEGPWYFGDATRPSGRMSCTDVEGDSVIEWTYDELKVVAIIVADGQQHNVLYRNWKAAGPE